MIEEERIVAAAVFHGSTISLPPPARHYTILHTMDLVMGIDVTKVSMENQGFLTSTGRFVARTEGFYIASRANQLLEPDRFKGAKVVPQLFSEDLW